MVLARDERAYAAFISYSHADDEFASWFHQRLEAFITPRELVRSGGPAGTIPRRLGKVFRDRTDLSAAHDLGTEIREALDNSSALIVLCSPRSARSDYVNEEIRYFKALGRADRIFAVIISGEPHASRMQGRDPAEECFPSALVLRILASGVIGDELEPAEPLAADVRAGKDGRENGALKIIAGLIGVDLDELVQREKAAQRRRQRQAYLLAGSMSLLAILAAAAAVFAVFQQQQADSRRVEVVAGRARDHIEEGERAEAAAFLAQEDVRDALTRTGLGRWVISQAARGSWESMASASSALLGCEGAATILQDDKDVATVHFPGVVQTAFLSRDRLVACFGDRNGIVAFDVIGNAYRMAKGQKVPTLVPTVAWMPHTYYRRPGAGGDVVLDSQLDGLFTYDLGEHRFTRHDASGPASDQRVQVLAGPTPEFYFSIRQSGNGHFFSPDQTNAQRAEAQNRLLEGRGFRECAIRSDEQSMLCVLDGGSAIFMDWTGAATPLPLRTVDSAVSVFRLDTTPERLAIVDDKGVVSLVDPDTRSVTAVVRSDRDDLPLAVSAFGARHVLIATEGGRVCLAMVDRPACDFRDHALKADSVVSVAVEEATSSIWLRTNASDIQRLTLDREIMRPGGAGPARPVRPVSLSRLAPTAMELPARALTDLERSGGEVAFGKAPQVIYISQDLRWRLQRSGANLLLVFGDSAFDLSSLGEYVRLAEGRTALWMAFGDRLARIDLADVDQSRLQLTVFATGPTDELWTPASGELSVVQLPGRTLIARADGAFGGEARISATPNPFAVFDDARGLLFVSMGGCEGSLFDLGYSEPVLETAAPCELTEGLIISSGAVELHAQQDSFVAPLPAVYVSP